MTWHLFWRWENSTFLRDSLEGDYQTEQKW